MIDPITVGLSLLMAAAKEPITNLATKALEGVVGGRADYLLSHGFSKVKDIIAFQGKGLPENHDLLKALRKSMLTATDMLREAMKADGEEKHFRKTLQAWIDGQQATLSKIADWADWNNPAVNELELFFANEQTYTQRKKDLDNLMSASWQTYVADQLKMELPEAFTRKLNDGWLADHKSITWQQTTMVLMIESLRDPKDDIGRRAATAFEHHFLSEIKLHLSDTQTQLTDIKIQLIDIGEQMRSQFPNHALIIENLSATVHDQQNTIGSQQKTVETQNDTINILVQILSQLKPTVSPIKRLRSVVQNLTPRANNDVVYRFNEAGRPESYSAKFTAALEDWDGVNVVFSIAGQAGIGKSFLAQEVAMKYVKSKADGSRTFDIVWWIDAEDLSKKGNSVEAGKTDDLAELIKAEVDGEKLFDINMASTGWLLDFKNALNRYNYLLIFDNACDNGDGVVEKTAEEFRKTYLPTPSPEKRQRIILTSRLKHWPNPIELDSWTCEELGNFLNTALKSKGLTEMAPDDPLLKKLHRESGGLPLEAPLLAAYIIKHNCNPTSYIELLKRNHKLRNGKSISNIFNITYRTLGDEARMLLNMMAFFAPDEVPLVELIQRGQVTQATARYKKEELSSLGNIDVHQDIGQLEDYGLIIPENQGELYSIHRVWQLAIRELLGRDIEQAYALALSVLVQAANGFMDQCPVFYRRLLAHTETLSEHFIPSMDATVRDDLTALLRAASDYGFRIGAVARALRMNDKVIALKPFDQTLVHQIGIRNSHNLILRDHCDRAMELACDAFSYFSSSAYSGDDTLTMTERARQCVAKVHQRQGNFDQAKALLQICKATIDDLENELNALTEPDTLKEIGPAKRALYSGILHDLGSVWWEEGLDYDQSLQFFDEATAFKMEINHGRKDLYFYLSKMIRGVVLGLMGNYEDQFTTHQEVYDFLSVSTKEYRRYAYTGYYLLHFGWDKLGWEARHTAESKAYEAYFTINDEFIDILEGDVKYAIITTVVELRKAARYSEGTAAELHFAELKKLLEPKKNGSRYLDDGTVAVSAVLDYALYLEDRVTREGDETDLAKLQHVISLARAMLTACPDDADGTGPRIGYARTGEVDRLYNRVITQVS